MTQEQIFSKYERYVYVLGKRVKIDPQSNINTREDLYQYGRLTLWESILKYNYYKERKEKVGLKMVPMSTYVYTYLDSVFKNINTQNNRMKRKCAELISLEDNKIDISEDQYLYNMALKFNNSRKRKVNCV